MPSTIGKCKLFRIKHNTILEGETFLRNKHEIEFFKIKCTFFGRKENIVSRTSLCEVNFIHEWDLQFEVDSRVTDFWAPFHDNLYLLSECLPEIYWEDLPEEIFCHISFKRLTSNKTTYYLSEHLEFNEHYIWVYTSGPPFRFNTYPIVCGTAPGLLLF